MIEKGNVTGGFHMWKFIDLAKAELVQRQFLLFTTEDFYSRTSESRFGWRFALHKFFAGRECNQQAKSHE